MNNKIEEQIIVEKDFTDAPGARYKKDGPKSGEEFYETLLKPKFDIALEKGGKIFIDMDNTWGYASSFLSASFGRLSKEYSDINVENYLKIKSNDNLLIIDKIKKELSQVE